MRQHSSLDYARFAKLGFLLGLVLLVIGAGGGLAAHAYFTPVPAWEDALFVDLEIIGVLLGLLSPLLFGVVLPLVE